nr:MAG TPA: replicative helicase [Caudoviricetes sp.]
MAEKNKKKLSAFEQQKAETIKKVSEYKLQCEANVVAILYKDPDQLYNTDIDLSSFTSNVWKVFWQIAHDIIIVENKNTLDDITIGMYLNKHPKLNEKYVEYGGYDTITAAMGYVKEENLDGYVSELHKWDAVRELCEKGFPVKDRLSDYADMSEEEIYNEHEAYLNHIFANSSAGTKSVNVFDGMYEFIQELNECSEAGMPFYNADLLNAEVGGFNLNGNIYGLGAGSGCGKSNMAFNWIIPSAMKYGEKVVMCINEEDERRIRKELLIWVANNIFHEELHKRTIRDGGFDGETIALLKKCADWIDQQKDEHILTVIPLERYSVNTVIKIIKKYSSAFGVRVFILDTLKESFDAKTDEIYKSMMRDMVTLYDVVKPSAKNVGLFVTYQLGKGSLKMRYLTNNEIGQAKSIVDVMSVNLMMRRPYEDEYEGGSKEVIGYRPDGKDGKSKIAIKLKKDDNPMITFICKNRFGISGGHQVVSSCDLSTNTYKDIGYCNIPQDF